MSDWIGLCLCPYDVRGPGPQSVDVNREMTAHTVTGLKAEKVYKVWVKSADAFGVHSEYQSQPIQKEVLFSGTLFDVIRVNIWP